MSAIFFKVNPQQAKEINFLMKEEGYTNKAEFFRFLIKFFKYHKSPEEHRFEKAAKELGTVLSKLHGDGKLNISIDDQLKDV